jgi:hypothetical protein
LFTNNGNVLIDVCNKLIIIDMANFMSRLLSWKSTCLSVCVQDRFPTKTSNFIAEFGQNRNVVHVTTIKHPGLFDFATVDGRSCDLDSILSQITLGLKGGETAIIIDSLNPLFINREVSHVLAFLKRLLKLVRKDTRILAVYHQDMPVNWHADIPAILADLFSAFIDLHSNYCHLLIKQAKLVNETLYFQIADKKINWYREKLPKIEKAAVTPSASFNLATTESQAQKRDQMVLPHVQNQGLIFYQHDYRDDYDEEVIDDYIGSR